MAVNNMKHEGAKIRELLKGFDVTQDEMAAVLSMTRQNRHQSLEQTMNYLRSLGLRPNVNYSKKAPKL